MIRGGTGMKKSLVTWSGSWGVRRNYEFQITVIFSQKYKGGIRPPDHNFFVFASMACHLAKLCKVMLLTQKTEKKIIFTVMT